MWFANVGVFISAKFVLNDFSNLTWLLPPRVSRSLQLVEILLYSLQKVRAHVHFDQATPFQSSFAISNDTIFFDFLIVCTVD